MAKEYYAAIDLGGTNLKLGLISARGKLIKKMVFSTKDYRTKASMISGMCAAVENLIASAGLRRRQIRALGIGAPGLIDSEKGVIHTLTNIKGWSSVNIKQILEKRLGIKTFADNDVNLMALGELRLGAGKGAKNAVCLTLGTGVGGGIIIDGEVYRGSSLAAGEIGHTILNEKGPLCGCGARGCLEAYIGNDRILALARQMARKNPRSRLVKMVNGNLNKITHKTIDRAAAAGDATALKIWQSIGEHLGTALVDVIHILNPDKIIIGGGIAKAGKFLFDPLRRTVKQKGMSVAVGGVKIVRAKIGEDAGIIGAGIFAAESIHRKKKR